MCSSILFFQYYRVYSPIAFGKKTDPHGLYIRKYVPQLAKYPDNYIFEPWTAPLTVQKVTILIEELGPSHTRHFRNTIFP
jgi:cryptochrome